MSTGKKKKILILTVILLFLIVGLVSVFVYEYFRIKPENVRVSNITSNSVTVSWSTKNRISASVIERQNSGFIPFVINLSKEGRFYDSRDENSQLLLSSQYDSQESFIDKVRSFLNWEYRGQYYTHHVVVNNLEPDTHYNLFIGDTFLFKEIPSSDDLLSIKTSEIPNELPSPRPAYGSVKNAEGIEEAFIEDLPIVFDAIVYMNIRDEFSGETSSISSGSVNIEGNWYVDISGLTDDNGEYFLDKLDTEATNLLLDIEVDAGPYGSTRTFVPLLKTSPTPDIVINDELGFSQTEEVLSSLGIIKGVEASSCSFVGWCGPCFDGNLDNPCQCPQEILSKRGCIEQDGRDPREAAQEISGTGSCSGGGVNGKSCIRFSSGSCKKCENGYWKDADTEMCNASWPTQSPRNCENVDPPQQDTAEGLSCYSVGSTWEYKGERYVCTYKDSYSPVWVKAIIYNESPGDLKEGDRCYNKDECKTYGFVTFCCSKWVADKLFWEVVDKDLEEEDPTRDPDIEVKPVSSPCYLIGDPCTYESGIGVCNSSFQCVEPKGSCTPYDSSAESGVYSSGGQCIATECKQGYEVTNGYCVRVVEYSDEVCWKSGSGGYYRVDADGNLFRCTNSGTWKESPTNASSQRCLELSQAITRNQGEIPSSAPCNNDGDLCSLGETEFVCKDNLWKKFLADDNVPAGPAAISLPGEICQAGKCYCKSIDDRVSEGEYCPEVKDIISCNKSLIGKICSEDGWRCVSTQEAGEYVSVPSALDAIDYFLYNEEKKIACVESENICYEGLNSRGKLVRLQNFSYITCRASNINTNSQFDLNRNKLVLGTKAENLSSTNLDQRYILDSQNSMVYGLKPGSYMLEYQNQDYYFEVSESSLEQNNGNVFVYIDKDDDGEFNEEVDIKVTDYATEITITELMQQFDYSLKSGFNLVNFPFIIKGEENRMASSLLKNLNTVYGESIYSIAKFDGNWKVVGESNTLYDNNDFEIVPGVGYLIKAKRNVEISVMGQPIKFESNEDATPIYLSTGWNLIGLYGTKVASYTAKSLIEDINKTDIKSDNVTTWERDKQMYEGLQISDGQTYGFDYPINPLESYFVRVIQGSGNWQPSLRSGNN